MLLHACNKDIQVYTKCCYMPVTRTFKFTQNNVASHLWCDATQRNRQVKWSRYRPGVAQRVCRGIALLFHDSGTRRGWVVSSTPRPHFTAGEDQVPIVQEAGWAPGPVLTGGKSRPHRDWIPDRPARSSVAIPTELPSPRKRQVVWSNNAPFAQTDMIY